MTETEGVIKYQLKFTRCDLSVGFDFSALDHWQQRFRRAGILGQDPERYHGLGFGNISQRLGAGSFMISGTQTGHKPSLGPEDYALVSKFDVDRNAVWAEGAVKPSSEALTHAAFYALDPTINFVFHVHSPQIWQARDVLGLAQTDAEVPYGTPAMAAEIARLFRGDRFHGQNILAMAGHEDGIIGFGASAEMAGEIIMRFLAQSTGYALSSNWSEQR